MSAEGTPSPGVSGAEWIADPASFDATIKSLKDQNPDWGVDQLREEIGDDIPPEEIQESLNRLQERQEGREADERIGQTISDNESHIWWDRLNDAEKILKLQDQLGEEISIDRISTAFQRKRETPERERQRLSALADQSTKAEAEIKDIKNQIGRDLLSEEKEIIRARKLGGTMNKIDQRTAELYQKFEDIGFTKNTKNKRRFDTAIKVIGAVGSGVIARYALRLFAPTQWAGMWAGGLVGGAWGYYRGKKAEEAKQLGAQGYVSQYEHIKGDSQIAPDEREKQALAFLEQVLTPSKGNNVFKGNHSDLLNLLAFYRNELTQRYVKEAQESEGGIGMAVKSEDRSEMSYGEGEKIAIMENISGIRLKIDETLIDDFFKSVESKSGVATKLLNTYVKSDAVRGAIAKAGMRGALKGAAWGAGLGFASDLVAHCFAAPAAEEAAKLARENYIQGHIGAEWSPVNQVGSADLPMQPTAEGWGLSAQPTHFGNYLSQTVGEHLGKELTLPEGIDHDKLVTYLNYVKAPPAYAHVPINPQGLDNVFHFNENGLQDYLNHLHVGSDGVINFRDLADSNYIAEAVAQVPEKLATEAAEVGAQAGAQAVRDASGGLIYGLTTGAGVAYGAEIAGIRGDTGVKPGSVKYKVEPPASPARLRAQPTPPAAVTPPEPEVPPIQEWKDMADDVLATQANVALAKLSTKGWDTLDEPEQKDLSDLFVELEKRGRSKMVKVSIDGADVGEFEYLTTSRGAERLISVVKTDNDIKNHQIISLDNIGEIKDLKIEISERPKKKRTR